MLNKYILLFVWNFPTKVTRDQTAWIVKLYLASVSLHNTNF
jgi:hypothetical protein